MDPSPPSQSTSAATTSKKKDLRKAMKEYGNKISKENRSQRKGDVTPPGRHRIAVYDGPILTRGAHIVPGTTPLHPEFVDTEATQKRPPGRHFVFVNDREYRLLGQFIPKTKKSCQLLEKEKDDVQVEVDSKLGWKPPTLPPVSIIKNSTKPSSLLQIVQNKSCQNIIVENTNMNNENENHSTTELSACQSINNSDDLQLDPLPPSESVSYHDACEDTADLTWPLLKRPPKTVTHDQETQTDELGEREWRLMQVCESNVSSVHDLATEVDHSEKESVLDASESTMILMSTMIDRVIPQPDARE